MDNHTLDQFFYKNYVKCIVSLSVQNLLFCSQFESAPGLRVLVFVPMQTW